MDNADYLDAIESDSAALLRAAASVPPDTAVPACAGWSIRDLVEHQTVVWGLATSNVETADPTTPARGPRPPADEENLFTWSEEVRSMMLDKLAAADPQTPAWTFVPDDLTAGFWQRRMMAETMVHRRDAQSAVGEIDPFYPERAADAIDEYTQVGLRYSLSRPDRVYPKQSLHLHCTDTAGEWTLVGDDGPNFTVTREHAKGDAALRGPAAQLLLWIWGRPSSLDQFGDADVAATWQALAP